MALASILIFMGFAQLEIKGHFAPLAKRTFLIYLFHAGVWDLVFRAVKKISLAYIPVIIPASVAAVFLVSLGMSLLYEKCWGFVRVKHQLYSRHIYKLKSRNINEK